MDEAYSRVFISLSSPYPPPPTDDTKEYVNVLEPDHTLTATSLGRWGKLEVCRGTSDLSHDILISFRPSCNGLSLRLIVSALKLRVPPSHLRIPFCLLTVGTTEWESEDDTHDYENFCPGI